MHLRIGGIGGGEEGRGGGPWTTGLFTGYAGILQKEEKSWQDLSLNVFSLHRGEEGVPAESTC